MIDPLWKWRSEPPVEHSPDGREALLAGDLETAGRIFAQSDHAGDLVGLGDVQTLLGEVPVEPYERAARIAPTNPFVACGLSQSLVLRGESGRAVELLERVPDDPVVRYHLAGALLCLADEVRSVTRDERLVITSRPQFDVCSNVAERVAATARDPAQLAAAEQLRAQIRDGARLVWYPEGMAMVLLAVAMGVGLLMVVFGGANYLVPLVVAGALVGAGGVFAIVWGFRRQAWQVRARQVGATVWRHGIR
jgi:hypothetical protein